jgi:hypothetical protein
MIKILEPKVQERTFVIDDVDGEIEFLPSKHPEADALNEFCYSIKGRGKNEPHEVRLLFRNEPISLIVTEQRQAAHDFAASCNWAKNNGVNLD